MKYGDKYEHYKGVEYFFQGIALPLQAGNISLDTMQKLMFLGIVRYHEDTHDIELYGLDGALFIDSEYPHVIYQSEKHYNTSYCYAREVDDFFGYTYIDTELIKRFTLKKEE